MKNMKKRGRIITFLAVLILCMGLFAGCGTGDAGNGGEVQGSAEQAGVLFLKVNPEIAISYDGEGKVVAVESRNGDAKAILEGYEDFAGKETRTVVKELVAKIGEAGYFVEEIDGSARAITIEIETGSKVPDDTFLSNIADDVRSEVSEKKWHSPLEVKGGTDYGLTNYADTDYGIGNDGDTNYANDTDYGPQNDGNTNYSDSNYGSQDSQVNNNTNYDDQISNNSNYGNSSYDQGSNNNSNYSDQGSNNNSNYSDQGSNNSSNYSDQSSNNSSNYSDQGSNNSSNYSDQSSNNNSNYSDNSDNGNSGYNDDND